jgi:hypothetical protein
MTAPGDEHGTPRTMYFQLRYVTTDFDFRDKQISVSDSEKKVKFLLRKRIPEDAAWPALEPNDGFVTVTCEREMTERLYAEAVSSGQLSVKKGAVRAVNLEMYNHLVRTMRLIRWRVNSEGRPNPIRGGIQDGFRWSLDGNEWRPVSDCVYVSLSLHVHSQWTLEAEEFLGAETSGTLNEPLGHELLREAWTNREINPRSAIVLAVAAAEVGFKRFASKVFPDTEWILQNLPSPPLVKMLKELFPWSKLKVQINGTDLTPPDFVTKTLEKGVLLRNDIVHGREKNLDRKTVVSVITAARDLLYLLDFAQGQQWAIYHLSAGARKHFPQVISWPLSVTPLL